ncbi:RNA 2',3'-cyclic phosphodiesterase [archaeon]|nr:RNA 2',3'-cyclic phosphodiesterase [archaeon]
MRLFIAVELPKEVKEELYRIQKLIKPSLAKIKWVPKKNLHLTLKFIGETEVSVEEISERLSKIKFDSMKVGLDNFGVFSKGNETKVLWVDIKPGGEVIELQQKVDSELFSLFKKDQKFKLHLTLGRVKFVKKKEEFLKVLKEIEVKHIEFEINEFKLMESKLSKDGSKYIVLKEYKT